MALLKDVQAKIPSAETVVGRVIAYHDGKHLDLGKYLGEGVVELTPAAQALMAPADVPVVEEEVLTPAAKARAKKAGLVPAMNADLG